MPLSPGSRVGRYEVVAPLGVGGMGEVYRARDARLKREIALKILPLSFAADPDRLARFEREAQALAALNHPNIASIYGIEEAPAEGGRADHVLVLELVEGDTLAERIARGAIPVDEALAIARQISDALEAAHEHGVIHRDLKPANVKLTPDGIVKVLDFGLARLDGADGSTRIPGGSSSLSMSPTMTSPAMMTGAGVLLGTAAYMAPEQARGKAADKRADIWAFGVILFEMLTGARGFEGETVTETAGAVIHKEVDWTQLPPTTPPLVRTVLKRCLQKDPKQRIRDMGDVRLALAGAFTSDLPTATTSVQATSTSRRLIQTGGIGLLAALLAGGAVWMLTRTEPPVRYPVRIEVPPPGPDTLAPFVNLSPDGRSLTYVALNSSGTPQIWVHSFESGESRVLSGAGTVRTLPFWSPDGRYLVYGADGKLMKVDVSGGPPAMLCDVKDFLGGSWTRDDVILFSDFNKGIMRVSAAGGTPVQLTALDPKRGELGHGAPWALPDGRHFVYLRASVTQPQKDYGAYIGSVDLAPEAQDPTRLVETRQNPVYAPAGDGSGHLLFARDGALMAQSFDEGRRQVIGEPVRVFDQIGRGEVLGSFSASANGTVAYIRSEAESGSPVWVGRKGEELGTIAETLDRVRNPRLSPDGRTLALMVAGDLWTYDLSGRPPIKLTFTGGNYSPLWTPDGRRIVYEVSGGQALRAVAVDGAGMSGTPENVSPQGHYHPHGFTPDGSELVAVKMPVLPKETSDLVRFPLRPDAQPQTVLATSANEGLAATLSPDGRWLAYTSDSTGRLEIWVRAYPGPGQTVRVSPNGGFEPVWARNGRELYYREGKNLMAVAIETASGFNFKRAERLFEYSYLQSEQPPSFDVAPDGRFIVIKSTRAATVPISVVLNWTERLGTSTATH